MSHIMISLKKGYNFHENFKISLEQAWKETRNKWNFLMMGL